MDEKTVDGVWNIVIAILGSAIIVGSLMFMLTSYAWQCECIRRGVAEYNQTTGAWQWKAEYPIKEK